MDKILIVEDNPVNQFLLKEMLIARGFEVEVAEDGCEGLSQMKAWGPDLVLLDLTLPKLDGWSVAMAAKQDASTRDIPIIALTAHILEDEKQKAFDVGCDEYESKPPNVTSLMAKVDFLLKTSLL